VKKKLAVFIITIVPYSTGIAQHLPIGYFKAGLGLQTAWTDEDQIAFFPGITVSPGIRMIQGKDFALTLSAPITFGATLKSDIYAGFDLPAMIDLSIASAADNDPKSKLGFVVGAGVAYFYITNNYDEGIPEKIHTEFWGWRFQSGISLGNFGGKSLFLVSYGRIMTGNKGLVFGLLGQAIVGRAKSTKNDPVQ
jgi:hypothetical protein